MQERVVTTKVTALSFLFTKTIYTKSKICIATCQKEMYNILQDGKVGSISR